MRVLLTGANGFIGAHLTAALLASGHSVVGAVRRPADFLRRFPAAGAAASGTALPLAYHRLFALWFALGWPAFLGLVAVFGLMVLKPT